MKFRVWWIYFLFMILAALFLGLGATTYLLYRQHKAIGILAEDSQLMLLRTERLESLVQDQEIAQILAQQKAEQALTPAVSAAKPSKPAPPAEKPATQPKDKPAEKPKVEPAATEKPAKSAEIQPPELPATEKPEEKADAADKQEKIPTPLMEPTSSDVVGIKDVSIDQKNGQLQLRYKVANAKAPEGKAMGYTTVIVRGERAGKPWIEASPPMRLSPLGRPLNFKRGVPFSVQYHRPIKANFALNDKNITRLEFLVHSRDGKVLLLKTVDLKKTEPEKKKPGDD